MFMFSALLAASLALQPAPSGVPSIQASTPPEPSQVLALPEGLRNDFRTQVLDATNVPEQRLHRIIGFMFDKDGLGLTYKGDSTTTVAESYQSRQVNCLSFTLMAIALAREAGLKAQGQQINRVMAWSLVGDVVMQSLHANAVVTLKDRDLMVKEGRDYVLDIASNDRYTRDYLVNDYKVEDEILLASFYGNRAMELMAQGRLADSRAWLDVALKLSPDDAALWNNAGVLSQRQGDADGAEKWFLRAAKQNPRLTSALYNLVALYNGRGDTTRAVYWQERAERILRLDPYYQFALGERSAKSGDLTGAVRDYRRAISLASGEHVFHFGLARTYYQLGRLEGSRS